MANDKKNTAPAAPKTPKAKRVSRNVRFAVGETTLLVSLKEGKSGYNVSAKMRKAGERAQSGARTNHASIDAATAEFEKQVANAEAKGWKRKATGGGGGNAFAEIPAAPGFVAPTA